MKKMTLGRELRLGLACMIVAEGAQYVLSLRALRNAATAWMYGPLNVLSKGMLAVGVMLALAAIGTKTLIVGSKVYNKVYRKFADRCGRAD